ncbi:MAG TPA: trypsin-like peptidase domain-containing protein [Lapillicoccus sp.]|nr:trypsin-like peptidase domain-containing protein [Lapillicoccus sp.]
MRERPRGELTQPIDTSTTQEVRPEAYPAPVSEPSRPWWTTPSHTPSHTEDPAGGPAEPTYPAPTGEPYVSPWAPHPADPGGAGAGAPPRGPQPPHTGALPAGAPAERRSRSWLSMAAVALVAALIGGAVVLGGQQLLNRSTSLGSALPAPGPGSTARPDGSIAKIAADALPSVVTIRIKTTDGAGTGSGFVIDNQGHILTNNHVATAGGSSGTLTVELNNGTSLPATIVGSDASYDLAVLKITATDIPPLQFGASKDVVVGDGVIAVGAPLGLDATVTSGIVSALNRPVSAGDGNDQSFINAIQTDAAINPGNSGGPLLDMNGRVIGVNSAIARIPGTSTDSSGGNIGVGFAIPSDQAAKTAQQLITTGKADHPALGVRVDRSYTGDGAKLASGGVQSGSAADQAGLKDGDVITEFEGKRVTDADALIVAIRARSVGDTVAMKVQRGNQTVDVRMTLQSASS